MASPHVTVDDAVAEILPDSITCIRAMDSDFDWHWQTNASNVSTVACPPISAFTFEHHATDPFSRAETPSHISPAIDDNSTGSPTQSSPNTHTRKRKHSRR
eukprot:3939315-Rhodomonas_salina.1